MFRRIAVCVVISLSCLYAHEPVAVSTLVRAVSNCREQIGGYESVTEVAMERLGKANKQADTWAITTYPVPITTSGTSFWREDRTGDRYLCTYLNSKGDFFIHIPHVQSIVCDGSHLIAVESAQFASVETLALTNSIGFERRADSGLQRAPRHITPEKRIEFIRQRLYQGGTSPLILVFPESGQVQPENVDSHDTVADGKVRAIGPRYHGGSEFETIDGNLTVKLICASPTVLWHRWSGDTRTLPPQSFVSIRWLDVAKGYIPRRIDVTQVRDDSSIMDRYHVDEFREVQPGVWFPVSGTVTHFFRAADTDDYTPLRRYTYRVDVNSVKVSRDFTASDFRPDWTPGQIVRYEGEQTAYQYLGKKENGEDIMMPLTPSTPQTQPSP